jgi:hypothetical protein
MRKLYLATYDSRNWTFDGAGDSAAQAIDVCAQGLRCHAEQCELESGWWWHDFHASEAEAMKPDSGLFQVREIQSGEAYRDREPLPNDAATRERKRDNAAERRLVTPEASESNWSTQQPDVVRRAGGWFATLESWSGPWKTEEAARLAFSGDYDGAHALERKA